MSDIVNIEDYRQQVWNGCEAVLDVVDWLRGMSPSLRGAIIEGTEAGMMPTSEAALALLAAQGMFLDRLAAEVEAMQRASSG